MFVEAIAVKDSITTQSLYVTNSVGTESLKCNGNVANASTYTALKDRTDDLSFVRATCTVNEALIDSRIKQSPFHTQFYLKLSQSSYDKATYKVIAIDSSVKVIDTTTKPPGIAAGTNLLSIFTATSGPFQVTNTFTPASETSIPIASTPKKDRLLNIGHSTAGETISYFGDMTFLDHQEALFEIFGGNPAMLPCNPNKQEEGGGREEIT